MRKCRAVLQPADGRWEVLDYPGERRGRFAGAMQQHILEYRCCGVDHYAFSFQQVYEILHFLAIEIDISAFFSVQRKSQLLPGVLAVSCNEIQEYHVDVLYLVVAGFYGLLGGHERRNVPAESHTVCMCALGDRCDPIGFDRTVKLDLAIAILRIEINALENLGQGLCVPA